MLVNQIRDKLFSAFSDLKFDEKRHIYTVNNRFLPSVSKLVESHVEKVDFEKILPFSAAKASREQGVTITPDELRKTWHSKRDLRCDIGNETHSFMEHFNGLQKPYTPWQSAGVKFFFDMSADYDVLFREIRMYSKLYDYAGTEDLVLIHRTTGKIITADYKTNEDLWRNYKGKCLKAPFDTMLEHPYNKYQIQLSYYQIMLEEAGLEVEDRWLIYLRDDGSYKTYQLIDFTSELKSGLKNKIAA